MKKVFNIVMLLIIGLLVASCASKEDRANKLIKEQMSKTLYDYASYEPIETVVKEAKASMYTDTVCWRIGTLLAISSKLGMESMKKAKEAAEYMDIYTPSYYSSSYSDNQYYKYKAEAAEELEKGRAHMQRAKTFAEALKARVNELDENAVVGWEVNHKFRCKTKGGYSTIGNYRYVMDKGFKTILIQEDKDDEDEQLYLIGGMQSVFSSDFWDNY